MATFERYKGKLLPQELKCCQLLFNLVMNAFWKIYYQKQRFSPSKHVYAFFHWHYITHCFPFGLDCQEAWGQAWSSVTITVLSFVVKHLFLSSFLVLISILTVFMPNFNKKLHQIPSLSLFQIGKK